MAAVFTVTHRENRNGWQEVFGTVALDNSYPTNGEAVDIDGLEQVFHMSFGDASGYAPAFVRSTQKTKVYYGDNNNASDGPLIEVPNTTDLSALTAIPFHAYGK